MERYRSYNSYMRSIFGEKVYKLSVDGGMTCPNRDGTVGTGGCTFCLGGSGDFAEFCGDIDKALDRAKLRVAEKYGGGRFIAYYQSFSNTYAPVSYLRSVYAPALRRDDIVGISIGTRPDCLGDDVIELLCEMNEKKPVWVELGLQTVHETTAQSIRRGYTLDVFDAAVDKLRRSGIECVAHLILGLPGESREMMLDSVRYIARCGVGGVKLQLLHILEGTDMAEDYRRGLVPVMGMDEYIALVAECVRLLPPETVIHRLTGDGAKRHLIAPMWSADKKRVLNAVRRYFEDNDVIQGSAFSKSL